MGDDKSGQCAHGYYGLCPHCYDSLRAANARLQAWHDAVMGQETIGFEIVFKTGKWLKYDPSGFAPETKTELIIRPQPLAKE